jgi:serine O-acetyltransferase
MIQSGVVPVHRLWRSVRREAETAVARDPIFGASLSTAILDHPDLAGALSHQIGERLGKSPADRRQLAQIARGAFAGSPDLVDAASRDLQSIAVHDPATTALLPPLLNFKGYVALQAWRVSNWLWRRRRNDLALLLQSLSSDQL